MTSMMPLALSLILMEDMIRYVPNPPTTDPKKSWLLQSKYIKNPRTTKEMEEWARAISKQIWTKRRVWPEERMEEVYSMEEPNPWHILKIFKTPAFYRGMVNKDHIF